MKKFILSALFSMALSQSHAQNITAAEYFFDTDPGTGNGTALSVGAAGTTVNFTASISTISLSNGMHLLCIRTMDATGIWGLFDFRIVYVTSFAANAGDIVAAEYFIDNDPGPGNGTALSVGATGPIVNFTASIPVSLPNGIHLLAIRTKNADGNWGLFDTRLFYSSGYAVNAGDIVGAEFFIDNDPGPGNGTPVSVGTTGAVVNFSASIPTSTPNGIHLLGIRTKNADGNWGLFDTRIFNITPFVTTMAAVANGEYFLDTDPGIGNGTAFNFTTPGSTVNQLFSFPIAVNTSNGNHLLVMRTRDANGFWGLFDTTMIAVSGSTLPLHLLNFTGKKVQDRTLLEWKTENEQNTSYFEIERSKNGMDFNPIGSVASFNGTGTNQYSFVDPLPIKGLNFYRLRQVDRNGRFEYSTIIKLLFEGYGKPMILYPNPANNYIQFDFAGKQKTVYINVYDALGKEVINTSLANQAPLKMDISILSKGQYFIQLSDGETIAAGSFIKQ